MNTTVIIRSINRPTLINAVESSLREGFKVLVIGDGIYPQINEPDAMHSKVKIYCTGKKYGHYGYMALNLGALLAETDFVSVLDDDDEFVVGAGDIIRAKLKEKPEIDIWIPGLRFNNGMVLCNDKSLGIRGGNVACPTYRTDIFTRIPFTHDLVDKHPDYSDFIHVSWCFEKGY